VFERSGGEASASAVAKIIGAALALNATLTEYAGKSHFADSFG
jgi:hypothetical protein